MTRFWMGRAPEKALKQVRCLTAARVMLAGGLALLGTVACGESATATPTPAPPPPFVATVQSVAVSPATAQLQVGATASLAAVVRDQRDSVMTGKTISWTSSSAAVATVSAAGLITGVAAGSATITATVDGKAGTAAVTVSAATGGPTGEFQTTVPPIALNVIVARPTDNAATLSVYSATERDVTVTVNPGARTVTQHVLAATTANVDLTGMTANSAYTYRVDAPSATAVSGQFRTARTAGSTYRFVMQADSHLDANSDTRIYANTLNNMVNDDPDFLMDLGDTFMTDKYPVYQDAAAQYYAQRYYFGLVGRTVPTYLVQGNHDAELGWLANTMAPWAAGMRARYFAPVLANPFYSSALAPRNYYAWTWGDATFIVLDPYGATLTQPSRAPNNWAWTLGREQYDWLNALLQRTTSPYTFVFLHNLVGGSGSEGRGGTEASRFWEWGGANADGSAGFATQRAGWAKPIHDLLVQHKVSAVFHGHDHLYVHQERDGIAYQEVPQPSFARENSIASAVDYGYLSGTLLGSSGHLRVTVSPAKATVEYVRSRLTAGNGDVVDRYDIAPARR